MGSKKIYFVVILLMLHMISCNTSPKEAVRREIPVQLAEGDIVFRCGYGVVSTAVAFSDNNGAYSHVGVVAKVDEKWCVIHEVPFEGETAEDDKVYCEDISDFFNSEKAQLGAIYRFEGLDSLQREKIKDYLLFQLEKQTPFDHDYSLECDSLQYCSELVWRSFMNAEIDLTDGRRTEVSIPIVHDFLIMPSDIEKNKKLKSIYKF